MALGKEGSRKIQLSRLRESPILYAIFTNTRFRIGLVTFAILIVMGFVGPILYPRDPLGFAQYLPNLPPSLEHPLGTDATGRDIFAQFLHGIRMSLYIGFITGVVSTIVGLIIGAVAGMKGGILDEALMGLTNIVLSVPSWLVAVLILSLTPPENRSPEIIGLILGVFSWPWFARAVRAQIFSLREREFIALSRMAGYGDFRLAIEELLPLMGSFIVSSFAGLMAAGIGGEAGLAILGIGLTKYVSLGVILYWAGTYQAYVRGAWWHFLPAGLAIILLVVSLQLIAVGLEQIFNPRLREG